ncbi:MAG: hypothetical protein RLZZ436_4492 [Planctomycetota bacterium]|jgi:hypothetical protein
MISSLVLFSSDLMLLSTVGHAARQAGLSFQSVTSADVAGPLLQSSDTLFCLDLSASGADPQALAAIMPPEVLSRAIAFGPHVHTTRLDAARDAGFGTVLSRGQFVSRMQSGNLQP